MSSTYDNWKLTPPDLKPISGSVTIQLYPELDCDVEVDENDCHIVAVYIGDLTVTDPKILAAFEDVTGFEERAMEELEEQ